MSAAPTGPEAAALPQESRAKVLRFRKATKEAAKLRLALIGGSKSGKTYTALAIAQALVPGGRIAVIDTEHRSASKYAGPTATPHGFEFDSLELETFHPRAYIEAIHAAEEAGFDVLIIDSLSHEWMGKDGALELVDRAAKKYAGNSYVAWGDVTPIHREMIETILKARCHVIVTMRAKTEYVLEPNKQGKMVPRKIGIAPVQRDGIEYEFDVAAELTQDHEMIVTSSRCPALDDRTFQRAGADVAAILRGWLASDGVAAAPAPPAAPRAVAPLDAGGTPKPENVVQKPASNAYTAAEQRAMREIDPALKAATTPEEVAILLREAVLAADVDPADPRKRKPTPRYFAWYQAAGRAAQIRVGS